MLQFKVDTKAFNYYPAWQDRHEAVLLYMLEYPAARYREIYPTAGYCEAHLSRIVNSAEFRRRYRAHLGVTPFPWTV
jgi:hypothetical protein